MAQYKITATVQGVDAAYAAIYRAVFPRLTQAVGAVAQQARIDWMSAVKEARLWSGEKAPYMASIQWRMTGTLSAEVWSDYKHAEAIETGRPARDLKKMLDTSLKVRRTKDGKRFLVIPFRHNTPGAEATGQAMPANVYSIAKAMSPSLVTGMGQRPSGQVVDLSPTSGMTPVARQPKYLLNPANKQRIMVPSRMYQWGDRLTRGELKASGASKAEQRRYAGMVRMKDATGGKNRAAAYMTFRVMMEDSRGWIVPAKPGLYLAKGVADALQPKADAAFREAIKRDLA